MIKKLKKTRCNKGAFATVFTDLSKAVDCISHEQLTVTLTAYGFDIKLLNFFLDYFINRK